MLNPFPLSSNRQQSTLKTSNQKQKKSLYKKVYQLTKVDNIVAKGEIAPFVGMFSKAICCRGVRRHLYEGKG